MIFLVSQIFLLLLYCIVESGFPLKIPPVETLWIANWCPRIPSQWKVSPAAVLIAKFINSPVHSPELIIWAVYRFFLHYHTLIKKEIQIFLIYDEIQSGAVAKSYMRKGFLIYTVRMRKCAIIPPLMRRPLSHIWLCNCSILNFLRYCVRKNWFPFLSVH
jgi:hypothetical protein